MGRPSVSRMLSEMDSNEITEWRAYEQKNGRLDRTWDQQALSLIDFRLQQLIDITIAVNSEKKVKPSADMLPLPWENDTENKAVVAPLKTEEELAAERADFYASLEKRNLERGITVESVADSIASSPQTAPSNEG